MPGQRQTSKHNRVPYVKNTVQLCTSKINPYIPTQAVQASKNNAGCNGSTIPLFDMTIWGWSWVFDFVRYRADRLSKGLIERRVWLGRGGCRQRCGARSWCACSCCSLFRTVCSRPCRQFPPCDTSCDCTRRLETGLGRSFNKINNIETLNPSNG